jgi:hypothetical protein
MIEIILVTEPFRGSGIEPISEEKATTMTETDAHLPTTLISKFIGVLFCIPSMFGQAAECEYRMSSFAVI